MFLTSLFAALRRWHRHRAAQRTLADLDDHMLADIGISRGNIMAATRFGR